MSAGNDFRFDFDAWMHLASSDPDAFAARRQAAIDALIDRAPEPLASRLRALQWRIDQVRARCDNPLQATIKLSNMMWERVLEDGGLLWSLEQLSLPAVAQGETRPRAVVLAFEPPKRIRD